MKNTILTVLISFTMLSCGTSNPSWESYKIIIPDLGPSEQLFLMYPNTKDDSFTLHWFLFESVESTSMFALMTFNDKVNFKNSSANLPATLTSSEVKVNSGMSMPFPLDQDPKFQYDGENNTFFVYGHKADFSGEYTKEEVDQLLESHKNWEGEKIIFR